MLFFGGTGTTKVPTVPVPKKYQVPWYCPPMINSTGCVHLINNPIRICATCSYTIDHVYINATCASNVSTVILQDISVHLPLCLNFHVSQLLKHLNDHILEVLNKKTLNLF